MVFIEAGRFDGPYSIRVCDHVDVVTNHVAPTVGAMFPTLRMVVRNVLENSGLGFNRDGMAMDTVSM